MLNFLILSDSENGGNEAQLENFYAVEEGGIRHLTAKQFQFQFQSQRSENLMRWLEWQEMRGLYPSIEKGPSTSLAPQAAIPDSALFSSC